MSAADAFAFCPLSIPFVLLSLGLLTVIGYGLLLQGELFIRSVLVGLALMVLPWSVGTTVTWNLTDPVLVESVARLYVGTMAFIVPALQVLLLGMSGQLDQKRSLLLVYGSTIAGAILAIVAWTTELVVYGTWQTSWGIWYPTAGALYLVHIGFLVFGIGVATVWSLPFLLDQRSHPYSRKVQLVLLATPLGISDILLTYQIGVYPLGVLGALGSVGMVLWLLVTRDVAYTRGHPTTLDGSMVWEIVIFLFMVPLIAVSVWAASPDGFGVGVVGAVIFLVSIFSGAWAVALIVHKSRLNEPIPLMNSDADEALQRFSVISIGEYSDESALAHKLVALLDQHSKLEGSRLYVTETRGSWRRVDGGAQGTITIGTEMEAMAAMAAMEQWLLEYRKPILSREIATRRSNSRHPIAIDEFLAKEQVHLLVPLVERDTLVGAIAALVPASARGMTSADNRIFEEAGRITARALTYIGLFREARARVEIAKELEVASAARHGRTPGEEQRIYNRCNLIAHYEAAAHFGGDWWISHEFSDGRVLVVTGDVTGHGVPAALISSTIAGTCETARRMLGVHLEVFALMELLNNAVLKIGAEKYTMSCFIALFDFDAGRVTVSNAGYPFPYICRRQEQDERAELHALVSRGTRLGTPEPFWGVSTYQLEPDDVVVFYSDSLIESTSRKGERYGERRLQRILRHSVRSVGDRACQHIVEDVLAHSSDQPLADDLSVLVLRMGCE